VAITYFNWYELHSKAKGDPAGIIILTYGLTSSYNVNTSQYLMKKLNINHIPPLLFSRKYLSQSRYRLTSNYVTKEPQSYFKNERFLFARVNVRHKALYLRALSMRAIDDKSNFIPRHYFNEVAKNPFLKVTEDKIHFIYESPRGDT
jgi:hypothetical protein